MGIGVGRVQLQRIPVTCLRFTVAREVVKDVAEIEVGFENLGFERDRSFVEGLRFRNFVA